MENQPHRLRERENHRTLESQKKKMLDPKGLLSPAPFFYKGGNRGSQRPSTWPGDTAMSEPSPLCLHSLVTTQLPPSISVLPSELFCTEITAREPHMSPSLLSAKSFEAGHHMHLVSALSATGGSALTRVQNNVLSGWINVLKVWPYI